MTELPEDADWDVPGLPNWSKGLLHHEAQFDEWVGWIFENPVWKGKLCRGGLDRQEVPPLQKARIFNQAYRFQTRLFKRPEFLMEKFSPSQIELGLFFLLFESDHFTLSAPEEVSWEMEEECIRAVPCLYEKLFAPLLGDDLAATGSRSQSAAPFPVCYMWWDYFSIAIDNDSLQWRRRTDAYFAAFRQVLTLKSEACLESVLHGLGHAHLYRPEETEAIIYEFLAKRQDISPNLRFYAQQAAKGEVC